MNANVSVVVGNKFESFSKNKNVITFTELADILKSKEIDAIEPKTMFLPGQGLGESEIYSLMEIAEHRQLTQRFDFQLRALRPVRAQGRYSHKRNPRNTIISVPRRIEDDCFALDLLVDQESELMADHVTGQHIQGMILVEAARQSFLAITEEFYVPTSVDESYYYIIHKIEAEFLNFVFPVQAEMRYNIVNKRIDDMSRLYFETEVIFLQCGEHATTVNIQFTARTTSKISEREAVKACEVLDKLCRAGHIQEQSQSTNTAPLSPAA